MSLHPQRQMTSVTGILFSTETSQPHLVSVELSWPESSYPPLPLLQTYFPELNMTTGSEGKSYPESVILTKGLNGSTLHKPLHIWYSLLSLETAADQNYAVMGLSSIAAERPWYGPVLVLKFTGSKLDGYCDASLDPDLITLTGYFSGHNGTVDLLV